MSLSLGLHEVLAGGLVGNPTFCKKERGKQHPSSLITLLILGIVIHYVSFLPSERESMPACQSAVTGRPRFIARSVFWVSSCPHPASERSFGLPSCPQLAGLERKEATLLAFGQAHPKKLRPSLAQVLFTHPPSSAGLALRSSHCVLGDSLAPNFPGTSGENGFQGHFQFYSSGKTFCVYLMVCSHPWLLVETAFCWQGVGWAAFRPPLLGSHEPTDQEFP